MKKRLPLFSSHLSVCITKDELYSLEEIALSRAIAPNNDIVFRRERFSDSLIFVTACARMSMTQELPCEGSRSPLKTLDYDLLDVHL